MADRARSALAGTPASATGSVRSSRSLKSIIVVVADIPAPSGGRWSVRHEGGETRRGIGWRASVGPPSQGRCAEVDGWLPLSRADEGIGPNSSSREPSPKYAVKATRVASVGLASPSFSNALRADLLIPVANDTSLSETPFVRLRSAIRR